MNSLIKMGFYNQQEDSISLDDVTVYGIDIDSLLYDSIDNVYSISLPLSQLQDSSAFVLQTGPDADTLVVEYTRDLQFISIECGFATSFTVDSFETTTHKIDSFYIVNPAVNTTKVENIKIYY